MSDNPHAAAWDQHASTYDELFAPLTGYIARGMAALVERRTPPRARVLDIACGTGAFALPALDRALRERAATGSCGEVVACDFSPGMLALTERAARSRQAPEGVLRCEVQNGEALTYESASFDLVASCFGVFLFERREAGWREAARVLRPGGTFVTAVWQGPATNEMLRAQMAPIMGALPERLRASPQRSWLEVAEAEGLLRELREVDAWSELRCVPFHASIAFDDWRRVWHAMQNNPVMGALLKKCEPDELERVRVAVFAHFRELAGGDDAPLALHAVCNLVVATRR